MTDRCASPGRWRPALLVALALAAVGGGYTSAQPKAPTPQSVIGFEPCADYQLATYEQIDAYFRRLAAAAPGRIQLVDIGRTVEGRTQTMAIVTSEQNMKQLGRYKAIARTLAQARDGATPLDETAARSLAREGRAVVWIDFGLHSTEVAHSQTAPLMAFRAVTDESQEMRFIRENVIFLLVPNMNPDGTTMVANWYRANRGTAWESRLPELYHKYVGHDDNRDWYMMTQPETRNSTRQLYAEWFPQIVYNQHQSGPFPSRIFVPPFDDPMNPNIPPLVMRGVNTVGDAITRRLDQEGKRGAISRVGFDTWWNGGMRTAPYFHNMVGILTETGHASATPATYDPKTFPKTFANGAPTLEPSTFYPSPFTGGEWHLRNSCDYMLTASMAVLDIAAKRREEWLYDIYRMGRDSMTAGAAETFVIPAAQWDRGAVVKMINTLRLGGIEIDRADAPFSAAGRDYPAGTFLIRGAQPFEPYVRDLLSPQVYPDMRLYPGGPPKRPYDITGWTLSYQMGVRVDRIAEAVHVPMSPVDVAPAPPAVISAGAGPFVLDPRSNDAFVAVNRLLKAGDAVFRARSPIGAGAEQWPAGAFVIEPGAGTRVRVEEAARALGLTVATIDRAPADLVQLKAPRVAVYHAWGGNMDEGWTRWVLEQFEFPYSSIHDADVRAGGLVAKYDAIVLPDATYEQMLNGLAPGMMPPQYTGGLTPRGVANLYEFAAAGGTLIAMDRAAELPLAAFGLPIRNVTAGVSQSAFYIPGAILRITLDTSDPVAFGMPAQAAAFFITTPAFALGRADPDAAAPVDHPGVRVVAEYATRDLVMSGWGLGERLIAARAAVVDAAVERGRVVLLGFRTEHRGQPHGTFKLLFNALLLAGSHGPAAGPPK